MRVTPIDLQTFCAQQDALVDVGVFKSKGGLELRDWKSVRGIKDIVLPIVMPAATRPEFLKRVLDSLALVRGINEVS
jgi:hypothetical protein